MVLAIMYAMTPMNPKNLCDEHEHNIKTMGEGWLNCYRAVVAAVCSDLPVHHYVCRLIPATNKGRGKYW